MPILSKIECMPNCFVHISYPEQLKWTFKLVWTWFWTTGQWIWILGFSRVTLWLKVNNLTKLSKIENGPKPDDVLELTHLVGTQPYVRVPSVLPLRWFVAKEELKYFLTKLTRIKKVFEHTNFSHLIDSNSGVRLSSGGALFSIHPHRCDSWVWRGEWRIFSMLLTKGFVQKLF